MMMGRWQSQKSLYMCVVLQKVYVGERNYIIYIYICTCSQANCSPVKLKVRRKCKIILSLTVQYKTFCIYLEILSTYSQITKLFY